MASVQTKPVEPQIATAPASRRLRVYMMDLLPTVPYYTGYLCAALVKFDQLRVEVGCMTYYLDQGFFNRQELRPDPVLLDVVSKFRGMPSGVRRGLKAIEYLINMAGLLARSWLNPPDVMHVQFLPIVGFGSLVEVWFLRCLKVRGIRIVYTVHNILPQDSGEKHRAAFGQIYQLADRLICHDESARDRLTGEFGVPWDKVFIAPHGPLHEVSTDAGSRPLKSKLSIGDDQCLVLWQGIVRPYKGISFLLKAWERVQAKGVRARLIVVGNGEPGIVKEIGDEVSSLGVRKSVRLDFRFVPVEELADYYNAADVLVYPYREITTSGALMTGIGYGKAIVATDHPVFREILQHNENALLVKYGETEELADQLVRLIEDPDLRRRLGRQARQSYLSGPQWPSIARQTMACYESAMSAH